ncbi:hypothetical protein [Reichenbachiella sp. MALMAid0571]|uniref:hypothetical protein n=1 Tax=Reichenbachiella sp. MALMAid0571 TaxID=3143939 RepID=UPI0032DF6264
MAVRYIVYTIAIAIGLVVSSCKDKVICPAFQSTYILNDSIRMAKYSLFGEDSLPKFQIASRRNKYGISEKYRFFDFFRKNYDLRTAPKKNQLGPPAKDSLFVHPGDTLDLMDEGEFIASDFANSDSLTTDSLAIVPDVVASNNTEPQGPKYKYRYDQRNPYSTEQIYYNKYFGEMLVDKRPPPKPVEEKVEETIVESDTTASSGKKLVPGFLKKKKKSKEEETEPEGEPVETEETEGQ